MLDLNKNHKVYAQYNQPYSQNKKIKCKNFEIKPQRKIWIEGQYIKSNILGKELY